MRRLEKNPLELIIIPIHMPEKSKLWTRGYCRQLNPRKGLPVVGSPYTYGNIRMKIYVWKYTYENIRIGNLTLLR